MDLHLIGRYKIPMLVVPTSSRMAEQELSAFFNAVTQLFGSEQAGLAAEDWLGELIESDGLPTSMGEWQLFAAKASARLASRVNALPQSTAFTNA